MGIKRTLLSVGIGAIAGGLVEGLIAPESTSLVGEAVGAILGLVSSTRKGVDKAIAA